MWRGKTRGGGAGPQRTRNGASEWRGGARWGVEQDMEGPVDVDGDRFLGPGH